VITTVDELKIGDRVSFIDSDRCNSVMTIIGRELTSTRDFEWITPWLPTEDPILCYRMTFLTDGWPNDPWSHRFTLNWRFNRHENAPMEIKKVFNPVAYERSAK
jgi:hypothetical protein